MRLKDWIRTERNIKSSRNSWRIARFEPRRTWFRATNSFLKPDQMRRYRWSVMDGRIPGGPCGAMPAALHSIRFFRAKWALEARIYLSYFVRQGRSGGVRRTSFVRSGHFTFPADRLGNLMAARRGYRYPR